MIATQIKETKIRVEKLYGVWCRQSILDTWRQEGKRLAGMDAGIMSSMLYKEYNYVQIVEDGANPNDF